MLDDAKSLKDERIAFEKEKNDIMVALDEERNRYIDYMNNLASRERDIEILENRLLTKKQNMRTPVISRLNLETHADNAAAVA